MLPPRRRHSLAEPSRVLPAPLPLNSHYYPALLQHHGLMDMASCGLRSPHSFEVAGLPPAGTAGHLHLRWPAVPVAVWARGASVRLAVLDQRAHNSLVEVKLAKTGRVLGHVDIRWASHFQLFELQISGTDAAEALAQGVVLRQSEGEKPLWVILGSRGLWSEAPGPGLLLHPVEASREQSAKIASFVDAVCSPVSLQSFGWQHGCVLDGLLELSRLPGHHKVQAALHGHLEYYFRPDGTLVYENYHCQPADGTINSIENTLPFAVLAQVTPRHPLLPMALQFWERHTDEEGVVLNKRHTSTEGSYTVGYPMAVLARQTGDLQLAQKALLQVRARHQRLFQGHQFPRTRTIAEDGSVHYGNCNWSRGVAWHLLGAVRTLQQVDSLLDTEPAREELRQVANWTADYQLESGLWSVFFEERQLLPDTAGSAGVAAALALGARCGYLDSRFLQLAGRTLTCLEGFLTVDGFLRGGSQSNKGGEDMQRLNYRPIYQMGMGLMAQLVAALHPEWRAPVSKI